MATLLYIGPGLGVGTILLVLLILGLVAFSLLYLIWTPIKKFFRKVKQLFDSK